MKEAKLREGRNPNGGSYWSQKQGMVRVTTWLKDNFNSLLNHGNPDWEWIKERIDDR